MYPPLPPVMLGSLRLNALRDRRLVNLGQTHVGAVEVEEQHLAGDDHRASARLAGRLIVPGLILQMPDHPHALAFGHVLVDDLG